MYSVPKSDLKCEIPSHREHKKSDKKSRMLNSGVSLNALFLAACGGGAAPPSLTQPKTTSNFDQNGTTFVASDDSDSSLDEASSTSDLTVTSSGGNDKITTGSGSDVVTTGSGDDIVIAGGGDDVIRAGEGSDIVKGGAGNDTIVLIGTTTDGQYTSESITSSAGDADMSAVVSLDDLNSNTVSEVGAGEVIDGGTGNDSLVIYGTAYINQATLLNLDEMWVNSEVILTGAQFADFGAFRGDGSSIIRVQANDLEAVTDENDTNKGGNRGHGNNTDGQDDDNPGQGRGGPNFRDKDGDDEDEAGGGTSGGSSAGTDGGSTPAEPTIVDISSIYLAGIGTLSLEGNIILIADDMHDFAGVTNVNGDGSTRVILNGDDDVTTTEIDLSAVNLSGIAELELKGDFNLTVRSADDYFGIGSIAVSGAADISLTIDSSGNEGFTATYDFSQSPLVAVDTVKVYGDTRLVFNSTDQLDNSQIIGMTDSLTIAFTQEITGIETQVLTSSLEGHLSGVETIELGTNVSLILDDPSVLASIGAPHITGQGSLVIDRTGMSDEDLVAYMTELDLGAGIAIVDLGGNDLMGLLPNDYFLGNTGSDVTLTTGDGFSFGSDFGIHRITGFKEGDSLDLASTDWSLGHIKIYYRDDSTEITLGENKIILEGFSGVLTNAGSYDDPVLAVLSEEARLDANHLGDARPPSLNNVVLPATVNIDETTSFYFDIDITDDISGVSYTYLQYQHEDGHYFYIYGRKQADFEGWNTLNEWFVPGTYNLVHAYGYDQESNKFNFNADDLETLGLTSSIEVSNSNPDLVDPVISAITFDQAVVDLSNDDQIFATIEASDDMSGVDYMWLGLRGPDGDYIYTQFSPETGMVTEVDINPYFTPGTYTVVYAWIWDNAGHQNYYYGDALASAGLDVSFELINPNADEIGATLVNVSTNDDLIYVIGVNDHLRIDTFTEDNLSGTEYAQISFSGPNSIEKTFYMHDRSGDENIFHQGLNADLWVEGTYSLSNVTLWDYAVNTTFYNEDQLADAGISFSFEVVAPLKIKGSVEDDLLIGGDGYDVFVMDVNFGNDIIESFTVGDDYVDLRATDLTFEQISQTVNADGLLLEAGEDSILLNGLTQTLSSDTILTYNTDDAAPVLTGITLESSQIDATDGADLTFTLSLENSDHTLNYGHLRFVTPDGENIYHYLNNSNGLSISEWLNEWTDAGLYELDYVYLQSSSGEYTTYNATQLADLGLDTSYSVINATEDTDMPVLTDFTISANTIEAGVENVLNFEAMGADATSGISHFQVKYTTPSGTSSINLYSENQFIGGVSFSDWADPGTYSIDSIIAYDQAGNKTTYDMSTLENMGFQTSFEVTNTAEDAVAPELTAISLNQPYYDTGNATNDPLIANLEVDETGSGLYYTSIRVTTDSGQVSYNSYSYNSLALAINPTDGTGIYTISQIQLQDNAGNTSLYGDTDLSSMGLDLTFRVLGDGPQPGVAVEGTAGIDTIEGSTADEVFTLHLGEDSVSFGANWGHDTIADFVQGDDVLDFSGSGLTYADLNFYDTSYGLFMDDGNGNDLLLQGFHGELQTGDAYFAATAGTDGNDSLKAGSLETVEAGAGDDRVEISDEGFNSIDGGEGHDTLVITGDGLEGLGGMIDLSGLISREAVLNFEQIDLRNDQSDTLTLTVDQVISMTDEDNLLMIDGDAGDIINAQGEDWIAGGTTSIDGVDYTVYTTELATLHVNPEVDVIL